MEKNVAEFYAPKNGNCLGSDLNVFFPYLDDFNNSRSENYKVGKKNTILAKQICATCPVKDECLQYALRHESFGIWGGKTERERKRIRRDLNINLIPREPINILLGFTFTRKD